MKAECYLFAGVAVFFGVTGAVYAWFAREPAGKAALAVAFLMSALIAAFLGIQHRRYGRRPQDRTDAEIREGVGPLAFFAPHSGYPVLTAAGITLVALGVVYALWIGLLGAGLLAAGVGGFVFQYGTSEG